MLPFMRLIIFLALLARTGAAHSSLSVDDEIDKPVERVLLSKLATKPFCGEVSLASVAAKGAKVKYFPFVISVSHMTEELVSMQMLSFVSLWSSGSGPKSDLDVTDELTLLLRNLLRLSFRALCLPAIFPCPAAEAALAGTQIVGVGGIELL